MLNPGEQDDVLLEVCAGSIASCLAAQAGGAARVELCENLAEGGTTPSYGTIALARDRLDIALNVMIRPRGGDFLYAEIELEVMRRDIVTCRQLGVDGIVLGVLTADGQIDVASMQALVALAGPLPVTFHRAFDLTPDPFKALDAVIASGCRVLLSSGQANTAAEGAGLLRQLNQQAAGRLQLMPGAGVREHNIAWLRQETACRAFHASAREPVASGMRYPARTVGLDPHARQETDSDRVAAMIAAARQSG